MSRAFKCGMCGQYEDGESDDFVGEKILIADQAVWAGLVLIAKDSTARFGYRLNLPELCSECKVRIAKSCLGL